ncbi:MAG TPA: DUF2007 domain-containing protein [Solirubrobacterales bacterium]|nr:DUF2007 domain-containing protein [Solirubrobacterales bacterium]
MSSSTSHRPPASAHKRGAHGGGDDHGGDEGGGGGGGNGGRLVKVAFARTEPEAELIQGLLTEADIPSVLQRLSVGPSGYIPGPADVMVIEAMAKRARQVLAETFVESEDQERAELEEERRLARGETGIVSPGRLAFWVITAAIGAVILIWLLYQAT